MSRSGAKAMRTIQESARLIERVQEEGLLVAASEDYAADVEKRVAEAMSAAAILATRTLGVADPEPFVIEQFEDKYPPYKRVCVRVDGELVFNYVAATRDRNASLYLLAGECADCGTAKLGRISTLADVAEWVLSPVHEKWRSGEWLCSNCEWKAQRLP